MVMTWLLVLLVSLLALSTESAAERQEAGAYATQQLQVLRLYPLIISNDGNATLQAELQGLECSAASSRLALVFLGAAANGLDASLPGRASPNGCTATFRTASSAALRGITPGSYAVRLLLAPNQLPLTFATPANESAGATPGNGSAGGNAAAGDMAYVTVVAAPVARFVGQTASSSTTASDVTLSAALAGPSTLPATLGLQLSDPSAASVAPLALTWRPGEVGSKQFTLRLRRGVSVSAAPLVAEAVPLNNLQLDGTTGLRVAIQPAIPAFQAVANHAVYRPAAAAPSPNTPPASARGETNSVSGSGGASRPGPTAGAVASTGGGSSSSSGGSNSGVGGGASMSTRSLNGRTSVVTWFDVAVQRLSESPFPSALDYQAVVLPNQTGCPGDSCSAAVTGSGRLRFIPSANTALAPIAINWTALPLAAILRVELQLTPVDNAQAPPLADGMTAVFVFGTMYGTCPSGTAGPWQNPAPPPTDRQDDEDEDDAQLKPAGGAGPTAITQSASVTSANLVLMAAAAPPSEAPSSTCNAAALLLALANHQPSAAQLPVLAACSEGKAPDVVLTSPGPRRPTTSLPPLSPGPSPNPDPAPPTPAAAPGPQLELQVPGGCSLAAVFVPLRSAAEIAVVLNSSCVPPPEWMTVVPPQAAGGLNGSAPSAPPAPSSSSPPAGKGDGIFSAQNAADGGPNAAGNVTGSPSGAPPPAAAPAVQAWSRWLLPLDPQPCTIEFGIYSTSAVSSQQGQHPAAGVQGEPNAAGSLLPPHNMVQVRAFSLSLRPLSNPEVFSGRTLALALRHPPSGRWLPLCGLPQSLLLAVAMQRFGKAYDASNASQLAWAWATFAQAVRGNPAAVQDLAPRVAAAPAPAQSGLTSGGRRVLRMLMRAGEWVAGRIPGGALGRAGNVPRVAAAADAGAGGQVGVGVNGPVWPSLTIARRRHLQRASARTGLASSTSSAPTPSARALSSSTSGAALPTSLRGRNGPDGFDVLDGSGGTAHMLFNPQYVEWCSLDEPQVVDLALLPDCCGMSLEASSAGVPLAAKLTTDGGDGDGSVVLDAGSRDALRAQRQASGLGSSTGAKSAPTARGGGSSGIAAIQTGSGGAVVVKEGSVPESAAGDSGQAPRQPASLPPTPSADTASDSPRPAPQPTPAPSPSAKPTPGPARPGPKATSPAPAATPSAAPGGSCPIDMAEVLAPDKTLRVTLLAPDGITTASLLLQLFLNYAAEAAEAVATAAQCREAAGNNAAASGNSSGPGAGGRNASPPTEAAPSSPSQPSAPNAGGTSLALLYLPAPLSPLEACQACGPGSYSRDVNASGCLLCGPGQFSADPLNAQCTPCPSGLFTVQSNSSACKPCIAGTYAPRPGSSACALCPEGSTSLTDGARECVAPPPPPSATDGSQYAMRVSFQMVLNVPQPDSVAELTASATGIIAPADWIVKLLVAADTARALRIPPSQVRVSLMEVPAAFLVNVTATMPLGQMTGGSGGSGGGGGSYPDGYDPSPSSGDEVDADTLINRLVDNPEDSFSRTKEVTGGSVQVQSVQRQVVPLWESNARVNIHAVLWPTLAGAAVLAVVVGCACRRYWRRRRGRQGGISLPPLSDTWDRLCSWTTPSTSPPAYLMYGTMSSLELQDLAPPPPPSSSAPRSRARGGGKPSHYFLGLGLRSEDRSGGMPNRGSASELDMMAMVYTREALAAPRI